MPEFTPDQESIARADRLTSRLMHDLRMLSERRPSAEARRELFSIERYTEEAEEVPLTDVLATFGQMATEFALARRWDEEVLCLESAEGELIPVSMTAFPGGPFHPFYDYGDWMELWERYGPFPPSLLHRFWQELRRRHQHPYRITHVSEAEEGVQDSARRFLAYRFAGLKNWSAWIQGAGSSGSSGAESGGGATPPSVGTGGGLQIQVSCRTPGLRLHVSPAYFVTWVFFGSPTTPVTGWVLPGRYIFAGDGPMLPNLTVDNATFCIPPTYNPALTRF